MQLVKISLLALLICGCQLEGNGEFGFKQATSWGFYHHTEKADETQLSKSQINIPPIVEWFIKSQYGPTPEESDVKDLNVSAKFNAQDSIERISVPFRSGGNLPHGIKLESVNGCQFTIENGVLDTQDCVVTIKFNKKVSMVGMDMEGINPQFSWMGLEAGCSAQGLTPPCSASISTYPNSRIDVVSISGGKFSNMWFVK